MSKFSAGLKESFLKQFIDKTPPWSAVGYITFKRTYARLIPELGRTEEWLETCARACNGLISIGGQFTDAELEALFDHMFHLRGTVSGRALWQLGTPTVERIGADSLQNCWTVVVNNIESFCFTFNQLMLGGGVGFNLHPQYVYELPTVSFNPNINRVSSSDCDFIVPDNRQGWVEILRRTLHPFFRQGQDLTFDTGCIRPAGQPISSFGGTASGSEGLVRGLEQIVQVLRSRYRQKLRPIDCLDIMNIIGSIVVAGNVRRSSEIAIGDFNDHDFLLAKNWAKTSVPNWRAMSNNSVDCGNVSDLPEQFWSGYSGDGEPYGLINLPLCRSHGRLADGENYRPDWSVVGVNPCAEITLSNKEPCNLSEIMLPNIKSVEQFKEVAGLLYRACKTISCVGFSDPATDEVVKQHHRLGIGVTGFMATSKWRNPKHLDAVYKHIEECDQNYSKQLGVPESIKLTTVKPSGTLSLLPDNCTPGMHAGFSRYLIRRIRFSASDPLVEVCRQHGYHLEPKLELDGSSDHTTTVVEFPMQFGKDVKTEEQVTVIDELELQKVLQTYWSDNSVSATHYYSLDELDTVKKWLGDNYSESVKTASFLLNQGHGFRQAPLEKITKDQYLELVAKTKPITSVVDDEERDLLSSLECAGGHCPIK